MGNASSKKSSYVKRDLDDSEIDPFMVELKSLPKVKFNPSTKNGTFCSPGPQARFVMSGEGQEFIRDKNGNIRDENGNFYGSRAYKKNIRIASRVKYLNRYNSNNNTKYGCNPGQYIKYEDGHYCCVDKKNKATPQEILNYINDALEAFFANVGYSSAPNSESNSKYIYSIRDLDFLLHHREEIMRRNSGLVDNLKVPPDVDENGVETPITLDALVRRYFMPGQVLTDKLEGTTDSEGLTLESMRNEIKYDENGAPILDAKGAPVYLYNRRQDRTRFGGLRNKKKLGKKQTKRRRNKLR